ncbi:unnamed protein product [Spirodela intermedia]|uniref:Uncharacterized protein n=1 Tax=Spirodela intermedia TaxID=51605 RepID=A0A7I8JK28_SPIIN|nr:unnamed protein product [Spirodela intermedia]CAA6670504.1 unnamed protein product [Spirodela intermedia]
MTLVVPHQLIASTIILVCLGLYLSEKAYFAKKNYHRACLRERLS